MASIDCPHGWKSVAKFGGITLHDSRVSIFAGICDSADRCGISRCRFHDLTREGTRRFQRASADSRTLEGRLVREEIPDLDLLPDYEQQRAAWGQWRSLGETTAE